MLDARRVTWHDAPVTLVIAHRGASHAEAENTLAAFRRAADMGADGVELDVRRTADDRLVVHHDASLGDGRPIVATPASELPDHVAPLADALDACAGMFVNIEIKNIRGEPDHDPSDWVAHRLLAELAPRHESARWLLSSFRLATIDRCRRIAPNIRTAWLVEQISDRTIVRAARHGHAAVHPDVDQVTAETVRTAHASGLALNVWTCNDEARMRELVGWGVDGICTDVPDLARAVLTG